MINNNPFTILQIPIKIIIIQVQQLILFFFITCQLRPSVKVPHKPLLLGKRMAKVASVAIGTAITGKDHPADLCLIARVADDWAELLNAVSKLTVITVWACASLLPFVAQFSLEHPLVVHF